MLRTIFIKCLKSYYRFDKVRVILHIVFSIILGVLPVISLLVMQKIMNSLQLEHYSFYHYVTLVLFYVLLQISISSISMLSNYYLSKMGLRFGLKVETDLMNKILELSLKDFEDSETHNKINRANQEAAKLSNFYNNTIRIISLLFNLGGMLFIIIGFNPWLLLAIVLIPIIRYAMVLSINKEKFAMVKKRTMRERKSWYIKHIITTGVAYKEINVFKLGAYLISQFQNYREETINEDLAHSKKTSIKLIALQIIEYFTHGAMFLYILLLGFQGGILIGDVFTYNTSISNINTSITGFFNLLDQISADALFVNQYFELLNMPDDARTGKIVLNGIQHIRVKNVSFKYKESQDFALKNITFELRKKQFTLLIGKNGSGKSTLIKILLGLYDDYDGDIYINDINLKQIDLDSYHKHIGIIFQDFMKYEMKLRENIGFGSIEHIDHNTKLKQAADFAAVDTRISLDTTLGSWFDDALALSGGEWQRIALSRAFLKDSDLYFLDEPDASLDIDTGAQIMWKYLSMTKEKICIYTSHHFSNISPYVDQIILLDNGEIHEVGTHKELMKLNGRYKEMFDKWKYQIESEG